MQYFRIMEIPACKMVSSGIGTFEDGTMDRFDRWFSTLPADTWPKDYLYNVGEKFCWLYRWQEGMEVPAAFEVVDFPGGLYAVTTDVDGRTDFDEMNREVRAFLAAHGLEMDGTRPWLGNVITPERAKKILGYCQMDYYIPVTQADKK